MTPTDGQLGWRTSGGVVPYATCLVPQSERCPLSSVASLPSSQAGVGPCISASAYEIDGTALEETQEVFSPAFFRPTREGAAAFDLRSAVLERLVEHGISRDLVEVDVRTTTDSRNELFSDRAVRPCGRFMLVAALRPQ